jgi:hypothetical protein
MKNKRNWSIVGATLTVAVIAILLFGSKAAFSTSPLLGFGSQTRTPTPPAGQAIPIKPIAGLSSLTATAKINVNGLINNENAQGDLNAVIATNNQGQSKITVTGSLLGTIAAQMGGSVVGLFTPSSVDIYKVPAGSYIVINSLIPVCVKPSDPATTEALAEFSPQGLMSMLTGKEVARGNLAGQETYNGAVLNHYVLNGDAFLAAAKKSSDPKLKAFGDALWDAGDADLYVDAKDLYPVAFRNNFSGTYDPLKFEGNFDVSIQLTGVNTNPTITLPASCKNPITP